VIISEIKNLVQYITSTAKVNCEFTNRELDPNEYPFVKVLMTEDFSVFRENQKTLTTDLPLELRIIVPKGQEIKALEVLERIYLKINQFNDEKGHMLEGTGSPEYIEETKTFEIALPYTLKLIIQDT
jgi:hypothetical protein